MVKKMMCLTGVDHCRCHCRWRRRFDCSGIIAARDTEAYWRRTAQY